MKRTTILIVGLLVVALIAGMFGFRGKRYEVTITQNQIDEVLQKKFPVTKSHLMVFSITYSNPSLTLLPESHRVEVGLDAELNIMLPKETKKCSGTILVTTTLTYHDDSKQFFLSNPDINKLTIQGIPQNHIDKITRFASIAAREKLQEIPVYTLTAVDAKQTAAKLLLKDVQVRNNELHATLGL